jgi:AraC family transcriptional regulator of adaptative response/methylated-DNA-[protein]-cysteine methyltransferase
MNNIQHKQVELTEDVMYRALLDKDSTFEGTFFVAVKTTGIFCRPTCTARKPKRENVEFFRTTRDAMINGYRPCRVCHPLENLGETPDFIQNLVNRINESPFEKIKDWDLVQAGLEPNRIRRWFKHNLGLTFQGYQRMMRLNHSFKKLTDGDMVTDAAFESGYESLSGFSEAFRQLFGSIPSDAKSTNIINITRITTPLGPMFACATEDGVCLLEFTDRRMLEYELKDINKHLKANIVYGENKHFEPLRRQMEEYFSGKRKVFDLPLVTPGTEFQKQVWAKLCDIQFGETRSYKKQAEMLGNPGAIRAVAHANGMNRISIIIPCHRVIGEDGSLTGYGGGLWRKKWLLDFEQGKNELKLF